MSKIVSHFTKFLYPFHFNGGEIDPQNAHFINKKGNKEPLFEPFSVPCESLRLGLPELLSMNGGDTKIADCYRLRKDNGKCREFFGLPAHSDNTVKFTSRQNKDVSYDVKFEEIKLYLFESNVGILEFEISYETGNIEDFINLNYFICEAKSQNNVFEYEKVRSDTNEVLFSSAYSVKDLIVSIVNSTSTQKELDASFFNFYQEKPITYSHILLDSEPENMNDLLFHVAKNYKSSYKYSSSCSTFEKRHPFDNVYWVASLNGAANISFLTDDETTNSFFTESLEPKLKSTYYFLFLTSVHQRYATNKITDSIGELDCLGNDYIKMNEQLKLARKYEAQAINLKFRAFFSFPSYVEHINEYHDLIGTAFNINGSYESLVQNLKILQEICGSYVERIKERDSKISKRKAAKAEIFISVFGTLVGEFSLLSTSWDIIEKVLGRSVSFFSPQMLIVVATLMVPLITIFFSVKKQVIEIKRISKELQIEREENLVEDDKQRIKKAKKANKSKKGTD